MLIEYNGQGICVQCKAVTLLNGFRACKDCFLGWCGDDGIHCNLCLLVIPAPSKQAAEAILDEKFRPHLLAAHNRVMQLTPLPFVGYK